MKARSSTTIRNELEKIRAQIESVSEEISWTETSSWPQDDAKRRITELVDHAARGSDKIVQSAIGRHVDYLAADLVRGLGSNSHEDAFGALCRVLGPQIEANLHAAIDGADYTPGPPAAERPGMLKTLRADLRTLEDREESLIVELEAATNAFVPRRPEADPAAILSYTETAA